MAEFAIKENTLAGEQDCALCGGTMISRMGPDLFVEGTTQVICRDCGLENASNLVHLLELAESASNST
ncbi:MAG: hypothetical protein AAGU11_17015 [Syntrophobacteraceae bacterium]